MRYSGPMGNVVLKMAHVSRGIMVQSSAASKLGPYLSDFAKRQFGEK